MSLSEWQKDASPHSKKVEVCFDRALVAELEEAEAALKEASRGMLEPPPDLENHVAELAKQVQAKTREFTFTGIGRRKWRELLSEHPPTEEQLEKMGRMDHNPETFPVAAMVATCTSPGLTEKEAQWLADEMPEGVFDRLWAAVLSTNLLGGDEKKAVATAVAKPIERP